MTRNNGPSYREQGRAVFLAAIMLVSVVAMSFAFAGGAAAAVTTEDVQLSETTEGAVSDYTVEFSAETNDDYNGIEIDFPDATPTNLGQIDPADVTVTNVTSGDDIGVSGTGVDTNALQITLDGVEEVNSDSDYVVVVEGLENAAGTSTDNDVTVTLDSNAPTFGSTVSTDTLNDVYDITSLEATDLVVEPSSSAVVADDDDTTTYTATVTNATTEAAVEGVAVDLTATAFDPNPGSDIRVNADNTFTAGTDSTNVETNSDGEAAFVIGEFESSDTGSYEITFEAGGSGNQDTVELVAVDSVVYENAYDGDERSLFYEGMEIEASGLSANTDYNLRTVDDTDDDDITSSSQIEELRSDDDGVVEIDTDGLDAGQYFLRGPGVDETTDNVFELTVQHLDVEFDDDEVTDNTDDFEVEFDSNRGQWDTNVSADGDLDVEDLSQIFDNFAIVDDNEDGDDDAITIANVEDGEYELNFTSIDTGEYEFTFEVEDSTAEDSATVTVTDADEVEFAFTDNRYLEDRGNNANITIDLTETDNAVVKIGDYGDVAWEVGINISAEDYEGDEIGVKMNTFLASNVTDTDVDPEDVFFGHDDDGDIEVELAYVNVTDTTFWNYQGTINTPPALANPLAAGDYELRIGEDWDNPGTSGAVEIDNEDDRAVLTLQEITPSDAVAQHTAPEDDDMGSLEDFEDATVTETSLIAEDDYYLVTIDNFGQTGVLDGFGDGDNISANLSEIGVFIEIEEDTVGANVQPTTWNSSPGDDEPLRLEFVNAEDYEGDQLILHVPLVHSDYTDENLSADQDYAVTYQMTDANPYIDGDDVDEIEAEFSFDHEEREISINDAHEDLPNTVNAEVAGSTNVAPGTDVAVIAASTGEFVMDEETNVTIGDDAEDRVWSVTFNLSGYDAGTTVELEVEEDGGAEAELDAELYDGDEPAPANVVIDAWVEPGDTVDEGDDATLHVELENPGELDTGEFTYTVTYDGADLENHTKELEAGEDWSGEYDLDTDEEGSFDWEVIADNDDIDASDSGTLTVGEEEPVDDDDVDDDDVEDDDDAIEDDDDDVEDDDAIEDDDDDDDDDDDETPGFGVAVALVALLAAAMLALRKQD